MTNFEAIKAAIGYPMSDDAYELFLIDRSLEKDATYSKGQSFDLAVADGLISLTSRPNISEGGYSITLAEKEAIIRRANNIYLKYNLPDQTKPKATFVRRM